VVDRDSAFVGTIPANYDQYLGPILFHGYADDMADRLVVTARQRVLEIACGTGLLTRRLLDRLGGRGWLLATDLNEAMIAYGRSRIPRRPELEWSQADATKLPVCDRSFDAIVCQFGLMFFPDKAAAVREAFRVLAPGGVYLFNVWDAFASNPIARITHETVAGFFPTDPPRFYAVPYGFHEPEPIRALLTEAGFEGVQWAHVDQTGTSPSAEDAATGLLEGNPIRDAIVARRAEALPEIKRALAARIAAELGDRPVRVPLRALVFSARRP
jgi:ubiquinone/menaquinone biosynthesis C-methylase UbiE